MSWPENFVWPEVTPAVSAKFDEAFVEYAESLVIAQVYTPRTCSERESQREFDGCWPNFSQRRAREYGRLQAKATWNKSQHPQDAG